MAARETATVSGSQGSGDQAANDVVQDDEGGDGEKENPPRSDEAVPNNSG
jgi:hypothetical protein